MVAEVDSVACFELFPGSPTLSHRILSVMHFLKEVEVMLKQEEGGYCLTSLSRRLLCSHYTSVSRTFC